MRALHIVQGDKVHDKAALERAAKRRQKIGSWVIPKAAVPGDDAVIYIGGFGFFATAVVNGGAKLRPDWSNNVTRYGAAITAIKLIDPPISLATVAYRIPTLDWARYPRGIHTPSPEVAGEIRELIRERRRTGMPELDVALVEQSNIDEARKLAILASKTSLSPVERKALVRAGSKAISRYVQLRANGDCEGCGDPAPFRRPDGTDYLEPHHTQRRADNGPDHPAHVIALCPTCHARVHQAEDGDEYNESLIKKLKKFETGGKANI